MLRYLNIFANISSVILTKINFLKQFILISLPLFIVFSSLFGQDKGESRLFGIVTDEKGKVLNNVHVIDRTTFMGATTNISGNYDIMVNENDTVLFSYLGFKSKEFIVPTLLNENSFRLDIKMCTDTLLLKSAVVYPFPANAAALEKDLLTIEIPDTARKVELHLDMISINIEPDLNNYRTGEIKLISFGSVVSQMYDALSHEGKMKRKYQQILEHDKIDEIAAARLTDSLIMRATGLVEKREIEALREYCDLQPVFIVDATEYELYVALLDCYKSFTSQ